MKGRGARARPVPAFFFCLIVLGHCGTDRGWSALVGGGTGFVTSALKLSPSGWTRWCQAAFGGAGGSNSKPTDWDAEVEVTYMASTLWTGDDRKRSYAIVWRGRGGGDAGAKTRGRGKCRSHKTFFGMEYASNMRIARGWRFSLAVIFNQNC